MSVKNERLDHRMILPIYVDIYAFLRERERERKNEEGWV